MARSLAIPLFVLSFASSATSPPTSLPTLAEYRAEPVQAAPPEELHATIRGTLENTAIRVTGPQGPLYEIWLRRAVPPKQPGSPEGQLGVVYGQLGEGTLVGAMRILLPAQDYRRQQVKPGVYTLRYALHPVDGNHLGVAPQRDFLLLAPANADNSPETSPAAALNDLSRKASGTTHPSVWSLVAAEAERATPALIHHADEDHWILTFRLALGPPASTTLAMSLVVVGHAPEA